LANDRPTKSRYPQWGDGEAFFEQANIMRSVVNAEDCYVMVEVGGGNGPRAVDSALALRQIRPDLNPFLVVVEALPTYVDWCRFHFRSNDLDPDKHWIITGIVSAEPIPVPFFLRPHGFGNQANDPSILEVMAQAAGDQASAQNLLAHLCGRGVLIEDGRVVEGWPRAPVDLNGFVDWSLEKMLNHTVTPAKTAEIGFVSALTLSNILVPLPYVDFMDVDIQHAEITVIPPSIDLLCEKVKLLSIGTHTKEIHSELLSLFRERGWKIIYDIEPYGTHSRDGMAFSNDDGVLTLQNPDFATKVA
jgi:hypothetical protein